MLTKSDIDYFKKGELENRKFWSNLRVDPSFKSLKVLDVGCGHGSLCVDIAARGASEVVGIDIEKRLIEFATENVSLNYPQFKDTINFEYCDIDNLAKRNFDVIVAKDSFEHILNLKSQLTQMKNRLKPGGRMYIGFGPLYNSPYGDHGRTKVLLPWGHLIFPERFLIKLVNKNRDKKITNISELGLNKLSLAQYREIFYNSGLRVTYFRINVSRNLMSKLFSLIKRIPFLEEYFSHNIYCILENR